MTEGNSTVGTFRVYTPDRGVVRQTTIASDVDQIGNDVAEGRASADDYWRLVAEAYIASADRTRTALREKTAAYNRVTWPNLMFPKFEGQFDTFDQWVNRATMALTGREGSVGERLSAMCVDSAGRRCSVGADFMRARDEDTFPVFYFWECEVLTVEEVMDEDRRCK